LFKQLAFLVFLFDHDKMGRSFGGIKEELQLPLRFWGWCLRPHLAYGKKKKAEHKGQNTTISI
jgi:hypothetical protein